jgi:phosphohistidine phosphatase
MGEVLREHGLIPDLILSSDALRARLTAEAVSHAAGLAGEIRLGDSLYLASASEIIEVVRAVSHAHANTVMVVGHNPGLEQLVAALTGEHQDLPTAALAEVLLPIDQWRDLELSTRGTLIRVLLPKDPV